VISQIRTLIAAGYETTSCAPFSSFPPSHHQLMSTTAALSWAMIELSRDHDLQARVRAEILAAFPVEDPSHDDLASGLPLLDALVHEVLRFYPPLSIARRTVCPSLPARPALR
jgi:cytochrome P450